MADAKEEKDFTPKTEDEIRQEVIEEFDLDEESDKERIEKLVKREQAHEEKLSTAIKQKKGHREKREAHEAKLKELGIDPETGKKIESDDDDADKSKKKGKEEDGKKTRREQELEAEVDQIKMDQAGDFSPEIQKEIRSYASLHKVSFKEAAKSEYLRFIIDKEETKKKNDDASLGGGKGNENRSNHKLSEVKPEGFKNLSDDDWKKKKQLIREGKA